MNRRIVPAVALAFSFATSSSLALAGSARILNAAGDQNFLDVQSAVNAAQAGDVVLVGGGTYPALSIQDRSITLLSVPGETVIIAGDLTIHDAVGANLVVSGLDVHGTTRIQNCTGHVWLQSCQLIGSGSFNYDGGTGVALQNAAHVVITDCTLQGGQGGNDQQFDHNGYPGGPALSISTSSVALYGSTLQGGNGGSGFNHGGGGGDACIEHSGLSFSARSTFQGGTGGEGLGYCGLGGYGLFVYFGASAYADSDQFSGGQELCNFDYTEPTAGNVTQFSGARAFHAAAIHSDQSEWLVSVSGTPGDAVYFMGAGVPSFRLNPALFGVRLVPFPVPISVTPAGIIPPGGTLDVPVTFPDLPADVSAKRFFFQGFVIDAQGHPRLGGPLPLVLLNRDGSPDCDANGVQDYVEIVEGTIADTNQNLVPDACDSNGPTWYVDVNAATGGNGSAASPFQTIAQALVAAQPGHTILVADGVYTGLNNRELDFGGKDLRLQSVHGQASCVIDCQQLGRAFTFHSGETRNALVQGFTIRNGKANDGVQPMGGGIKVSNSSPTIEACNVINCVSNFSGGGISLEASDAVVRHCDITGNSASAPSTFILDGYGGGLWQHGGHPEVTENWIDYNYAKSWGGGVYMTSGRLSHCYVRGNVARGGGGIVVDGNGESLVIDDSLIAGNVGTDHSGGLFHRGSSTLRITGATIAANQAPLASAMLANALNQGAGRTFLRDTILWGNAGSGAFTIVLSSQANLDVRYSDLEGGQASIDVQPGAGPLTWGPGNLSANPQFVDPVGADNDPFTPLDNDYRLSASSPGIDAAENASVPADAFDLDGDGDTLEPVPIDLDGLVRFADVPTVPDTGSGSAPIVDIGCYERQP